MTQRSNRSVVLQRLAQGPATQVAMLEQCGFSQPQLARVVRTLIDERLVEKLGTTTSTGGRRPVLLGLRSPSRMVLGIRLLRGSIDMSVVDLSGAEIAGCTVKWAGRRLDVTVIAEAAIQACALLPGGVPLVGIGVAAPGVVDPDTGAVSQAPDLGWLAPVPLCSLLSRRLGVPVSVDNDVNLMCAGEYAFGALAQNQSGALLYVGRGIGAATMISGRVQSGSHGGAAEVGLVPTGPGSTSPRLEDVYSIPALAKRLGLRGRATSTAVAVLLRRVASGEPAAAAMLAELIDGWAYLACLLALTADPDVMVLSGAVCELDQVRMDDLRAAVQALLPQPIPLLPAALGEQAILRGAGAAALREAFDGGLLEPPVMISHRLAVGK